MENKELESQLAELVRKGIEAAEKTGNFVIDQAPELIREFYLWQVVSNAMTVVIAAALVYVALRIYKYGIRKQNEVKDKYYSDGTEHITYLITAVVVGATPIFIGLEAIYSLIKIWVAPKIYLIEYFIK